MRTWIRHQWEVVTTSYWFVPALMVVMAGGLATLTIWLDRQYAESIQQFSWFYPGGAEGARGLLSTVASSVITVAGVVFSITIAALTQAASQFGPRVLRNFMRDRGNQIVLGTFVATFIFCLLVLRTIHENDEQTLIPEISVFTAVLLALASIAVLIYFIHHVSLSIQAPRVVAAVMEDLDSAMEHSFPRELGNDKHAVDHDAVKALLAGFEDDARPVLAQASGYIQAVDQPSLIELARENDLLIQVLYRPGKFVTQNCPVLRVLPAERLTSLVGKKLGERFIIGVERTTEQDPEFVVNQLVEIALRALSPSINDPFTAINCIDWLGVALARLVERDMASPYRFDGDGRLRVITDVSTFSGYADTAFNQIRQASADRVDVPLRMLETLAELGSQIDKREQRAVLLRHAELIYRQTLEHQPLPSDLHDLEQRYKRATTRLRSPEEAP